MSKNFALIGAAGYVAPRHLKAIQATGNTLVAAYDPNDSVGVLDSFFPGAAFFTEFERFDRHLEKLKRQGQKVDFVSVCSPNYLHDAHVRYALRYGAEVICEKPLVLNPWNLAPLHDLETETGRRIWTILQLRHHPKVIALRQQVADSDPTHTFDVDLTYITPRGQWYHASWKGDESKSGGIVTNIGIHLFDLLLWVFGPVQRQEVHVRNHSRAAGFLQLERARVRWFLSIDAEALRELPMSNNQQSAISNQQPTISNQQSTINNQQSKPLRRLRMDDTEWDFSEGFTDLHTESYRAVLAGQGWSLDAAGQAIGLTYAQRTAPVEPLSGDRHPLADLPLTAHPFGDLQH